MFELVEATDSRAVRNKNNVLKLYDLMINQKRSEEATAKFVSPSYIQHNPLIPDGSVALGEFFAKSRASEPGCALSFIGSLQSATTCGHI